MKLSLGGQTAGSPSRRGPVVDQSSSAGRTGCPPLFAGRESRQSISRWPPVVRRRPPRRPTAHVLHQGAGASGPRLGSRTRGGVVSGGGGRLSFPPSSAARGGAQAWLGPLRVMGQGQGVGSETAAPKISELPNVAGETTWRAGLATDVPVRSDSRHASTAGQSAVFLPRAQLAKPGVSATAWGSLGIGDRLCELRRRPAVQLTPVRRERKLPGRADAQQSRFCGPQGLVIAGSRGGCSPGARRLIRQTVDHQRWTWGRGMRRRL